MSLVSLSEMLRDAQKHKYAVGSFNVSNYEMIRSVIEVAEELRSPVILAMLKPDLEGKGMDCLIPMAKAAALSAGVPVCLHLDHCNDNSLIASSINHGFTSVMFDGSQLPFEENARQTKQVCDYAHQFGVTVEGELGHVTDAIVGHSESCSDVNQLKDPKDYLTKPEEVGRFIERTGVDALAVAIGTAHGIYLETPRLDFDRLDEINRISPVPLVLHGGSGVPDHDVQKSVGHGICKVNIYSEVLTAYFTTLRDTLATLGNMASWPVFVYEEPVKAMKEVIRNKIRLFGSAERA